MVVRICWYILILLFYPYTCLFYNVLIFGKVNYYHDKLPAFFNNFFITNNALHSHNTRSVSQIHIEFNRTNYGKFSIRYRGAIVWNSLPSEIRNINFYNLFKKSLKLYVQKNDT